MQIGSYQIDQLIGEGTFGRTFLGHHVHFPQLRACLKQEKLGTKPYTDLFREEAEIIAQLQHPSLPVFRDYLELGGDLGQILILNFVEGIPLDKLIETNGPISDEHLCWILDRLLGAFSYLHGRWNIIHCDVKPGNILLDIPEHNATLVDLGLAYARPGEASKAKGGTPGYLPPEFGMGLPPLPASDIYGLGKVALMATGGDPLRSEFPPDMHKELRDFLDPWIRHDPRSRPEKAELLRVELAQIRVSLFGRTSCNEMFKFRNGKDWTP